MMKQHSGKIIQKKTRLMQQAAGFTLIELMVTVVVMSIVLTVAVPSFSGLVNANRLTSQANEILAGLTLARTEAIKQNQSMLFCHSLDQLTCSAPPAAGWQGWVVINAANATPVASGVVQSARLVLLSSPALAAAVVNGVGSTVRFSPQGLIRSGTANTALNAILRVCLPNGVAEPNIRDIEMRSGGRTRVLNTDTGNDCPVPVDPV